MEDTRRVLIAFLIVFLILFGWTYLTGRKRPVAVDLAVPVQASEAELRAGLPVESTVKALPRAMPERERLDTLENSLLRIVFSSWGGTVRSAWLKRYKVELVPDSARSASLALLGATGLIDLTDLDMSVSRQGETLTYRSTAASLPCQITRSYCLKKDGYLVLTQTMIEGENNGYLVQFRDGPALSEKNTREELHSIALLARNERLQRYGAKRIGSEAQLHGGFRWVGVKTMYFLTALIPTEGPLDTAIALVLPDRRIGWAAGVKGQRSLDHAGIYYGPLDYRTLVQSRVGEAFDFGRLLFIDLTWVGLPILKLLQWFNSFLRNFGLAIVAFALVMKALFFPLSRVQAKQMKNMALLQPKLEELKRRYRDDPEGLNRETMQLYRLYKVNPLSGCLPLLIQMPIFFAMYQVLRTSVDLRQAAFVFWIQDLSLKDPYYVLPVLMGISSLGQSLLTSAGQQNRMLMFAMPVFMTVIFLNFPSGLQLYWFVFNVLSSIESVFVQGGLKWRKRPRSP